VVGSRPDPFAKFRQPDPISAFRLVVGLAASALHRGVLLVQQRQRDALDSNYLKNVRGDSSTDLAISSPWWRPSRCPGIARMRRRSVRRVRSWSGDVDNATSAWTRQACRHQSFIVS
jgi:hypothetical protein